jgi:hypothetical protein
MGKAQCYRAQYGIRRTKSTHMDGKFLGAQNLSWKAAKSVGRAFRRLAQIDVLQWRTLSLDNIMITIDLNTVAEVRHMLRCTIGLGLVLAFLIPYACCVWDGIKGRK